MAVDEREWARLSEELANCFAREFKKSRWQYLDTLPEYDSSRCMEDSGTLIIAQPPTPELPFSRILEIIGIDYNPVQVILTPKKTDQIETLRIKDFEGDLYGFKTPCVPYATVLDDGSKRLNVKPPDVRSQLGQDERGGTVIDGCFLYLADRGILRRHDLDLPGSQFEDNAIPYLSLWYGGAQLRRSGPGHDASLRFGSVVAKREFIINKNV